MSMSVENKLMTQAEVKEITGLSDSTLEQWRLKGKGPRFTRLGSRLVRYRATDVQAYLSGLQSYRSTTEASLKREGRHDDEK